MENKHYENCPKCDSDETEWTSYPQIDNKNDDCHLLSKCEDCGCEWQEIYSFKSIKITQEPEEFEEG